MRVVKPQMVRAAENGQVEAHARELDQVLQQTGEAVIVKDLNAVVTYWNREAASLYGFSAQEAVGQPLRKLHADIACRYGGEELAVVLPEANLESACARAEQLRLAIRNTNLVQLGQTLPAPTASFGVAVYPANGTKPPICSRQRTRRSFAPSKRAETGFARRRKRRRPSHERRVTRSLSAAGNCTQRANSASSPQRARPRRVTSMRRLYC